ncbi:hypothetical protein XELAEV_18036356mg [Xenopus laevis]|uniref:Uncharacterized protein n=1 Tax=Xenopus laevis TaxID=8355 RepID=A0A974CH98_XENLA|nr:hypothetical protein XELAEV_18036356mg [Xenopus laevis]
MFRRLRKALSKFFRPRRRENKSRKNDPPVQLPEIPEVLLTEEPVKLPGIKLLSLVSCLLLVFVRILL